MQIARANIKLAAITADQLPLLLHLSVLQTGMQDIIAFKNIDKYDLYSYALSLAILMLVGRISTIESWGINRLTVQCNSPISMVSV